MIQLRFIPIFEDEEFIRATEEYQRIWECDGEKIVAALELITRTSFTEERIAAVVYEGVSFSGRDTNDVMKLRASYSHDVKTGTLIHELSHRLFFTVKMENTLEEHKFLNLFLYDVWMNLHGEDFANTMVAVESKRSPMYADAWRYALSLNHSERTELFLKQIELLKNNQLTPK